MHREREEQERDGCILVLQKNGTVKERLCTSPFFSSIEPGDLLHRVLTLEDGKEILSILQEIPIHGYSTHKRLTFLFNDEPLSFWFSAYGLNHEEILMVIFAHRMALLHIYESMVEEKSQNLPLLRQILERHLSLEMEEDREGEEDLYNHISELNNDLINLQRELTKKNKTLEQYSQKMDQVNKKLNRALDQLKDEFKKGRELHQRFFPASFPSVSGLTFSSYYQPALEIGGDFYNIIPLGRELLIYLADVSGHGLDGAMINIFLRGCINSYLLSHGERSPQKILHYVYEEYVKEDFPGDSFLCLLLGVVDLEKMVFSYSNAGFQIPPFLVTGKEVITPINKGMPVSNTIFNLLKGEGISPFYQEMRILLPSGSTLFLTTDGLIEQRSRDRIYGEKRLKDVLLKGERLSPRPIKEMILEDLHSFRGDEEIQDDITFLIIGRD